MAVVIIGLVLATPNLFNKQTLEGAPGWLPKNQLNLGLDLRGGSHLLLKMNVEELLEDWLKTVQGQARQKVAEVKVDGKRIRRKRPKIVDATVVVRVLNAAHTEAAVKKLRELVQPLSGNSVFATTGSVNLQVTQKDGGIIVIAPTEAAIKQRLDAAISAAIETLRRRIDPDGVAEPIIQRQGTDRILVQVPGFNDPQELKRRIGKTAKLTFQLVNEEMSASQAEREGVPIGYELVDDREIPGMKHLLNTKVEVSGDEIDFARGERNHETRDPVIAFGFNVSGARKFANITQSNIGKRFAIVLDNGVDENGKRDRKVISAPTIQSAILQGQGIITGRFTMQEVNDLALLIKSGSLAASLQIIEEQTVGPTLGKDSIEAGQFASIIGLIAVVIFILVAYGLFGVFANIARAVNLILIVAALSVTQATLTLPGIAGIVLTIGMAVDANVLIFERIREELRAGKSVIAAIDTGYSKALGTILHANITTLIAAAILYFLGSGPIQGFAVTLSIGIATSVFTAFFVTRLMVATWLRMQNTRNLQAPI